MTDEENPPSRRLWGQRGMRISPNKSLLSMVADGLLYQDIAEIFGIRRATAIRWVTEARREFAERHNLPLETLHLDKRPPGRKPELSDEERRLINDYCAEKFGNPSEVRLNYTEPPPQSDNPDVLPSDEPNIRRRWAQDVKQTRHSPPKRQR